MREKSSMLQAGMLQAGKLCQLVVNHLIECHIELMARIFPFWLSIESIGRSKIPHRQHLPEISGIWAMEWTNNLFREEKNKAAILQQTLYLTLGY